MDSFLDNAPPSEPVTGGRETDAGCDYSATLPSLDVSEVSAMYIILFIDTSDMLFDFCIAVLGMERGALL